MSVAGRACAAGGGAGDTALVVAGALIIGLSTFQAEFDFGVPQFRLLFHPVLIAFAAGMALVAARSRPPVASRTIRVGWRA